MWTLLLLLSLSYLGTICLSKIIYLLTFVRIENFAWWKPLLDRCSHVRLTCRVKQSWLGAVRWASIHTVQYLQTWVYPHRLRGVQRSIDTSFTMRDWVVMIWVRLVVMKGPLTMQEDAVGVAWHDITMLRRECRYLNKNEGWSLTMRQWQWQRDMRCNRHHGTCKIHRITFHRPPSSVLNASPLQQ